MKYPVTILGLVIVGVAAWCAYALSITEQTLADQSRCRPSFRLNAINNTRHLLGAKTGTEIDMENPDFNRLDSSARYVCPI